MGTPQALGDAKTASTPRFHDGMVWYQEDGTNRLMAMPMDDPSKAFNPVGLKTLSEPLIVQGRYVCFRGEDDRLMAVTVDKPHLHGQIGAEKCLSVPVSRGPHLYFQGPGCSVIHCQIESPVRNVVAESGCKGIPAVMPDRSRVCWASFDGNVHFANSDGSGHEIEGGGEFPVIDPQGAIFWLPRGPFLMRRTSYCHGLNITTMGINAIRPGLMAYGNDPYIYYMNQGALYRGPKAVHWGRGSVRLAYGCAMTPEVQPGFVLYGGNDKRIYKVAL